MAVKEHLEALDVPPAQVVPLQRIAAQIQLGSDAPCDLLKVPFDATSLPPVPLDGLPESAPFLPQTDVGRMPSTSTVPEAIAHSSGSAAQFVPGAQYQSV